MLNPFKLKLISYTFQSALFFIELQAKVLASVFQGFSTLVLFQNSWLVRIKTDLWFVGSELGDLIRLAEVLSWDSKAMMTWPKSWSIRFCPDTLSLRALIPIR